MRTLHTYHNELTSFISEIKQYTHNLDEKDLDNLEHIENYINNITSVLINTNIELEKEIIEKNKLETKLKEKERFLESILNTIPNPILYKDENHNYIGYNNAYKNLLGQPRKKITQKLTNNIIPETNKTMPDIDIKDKKIINHPAIQQNISQVKDINGHIHDVLFNKAMFYNDDGSIAGIVGVLNDITEHIKLEKILTELSIKDDLTKLYNRRGFNELSKREWKYAIRNKMSIALLMLDIDHFKLYNDTYGHQAGDDCLINVASKIDDACKRPTDIVARYGGEEFIVLLPNTDITGAKIVAERIQTNILHQKLEHKASDISTYVTVSIGIHAIIPNKNDNISKMITITDKNLYKAKNSGRNIIIGY